MARGKCAREFIRTFALGRASHKHARKVTTAGSEFNAEFELRTRLTFDEHLRLSTRRRPRPARTWFETRISTSRTRAVVDLIRCRSFECRVGTVGMIPVQEELQLPFQTLPPQRDYRQGTRTFLLDSSNHTLDDSDAALLPNGAEALTYPAVKWSTDLCTHIRSVRSSSAETSTLPRLNPAEWKMGEGGVASRDYQVR